MGPWEIAKPLGTLGTRGNPREPYFNSWGLLGTLFMSWESSGTLFQLVGTLRNLNFRNGNPGSSDPPYYCIRTTKALPMGEMKTP